MRTRITVQESGRADKLLAEELDVSRGYVQKLIKKRGVKIGHKILLKPSHNLNEGDILTVSKNVVKKMKQEMSALDNLVPEKLEFEVVYEDENILVANKPSGMVVHPCHACPSGTLLNGVLHYLYSTAKASKLEEPPRPVNRIDKDTSGLVVIAKSGESHLMISKQFEDRKVEKWYQGIVFGDFRELPVTLADAKRVGSVYKKEKNSVEYGTWLTRSRIDRRRVVVADSGRWALSRFTPVRISKGELPRSWLKIQIMTGRTHQIRAQLKSLGFSLVGDPMYSNKRYQALSKSLFGKAKKPERLLLHSWKLTLGLTDGKQHTFEAKVPNIFKVVYEA